MTAAWDVAVIGGGFYGCCLALQFRAEGQRVLLLEKEPELFRHASYANQARVHKGYHYPRHLVTALRSCANFPRFVSEFRECVVSDFVHAYAIARANSKVSTFQFRQMCHTLGAPLKPARARIRRLFNQDLVEEVFEVEEFAFDALRLRDALAARMDKAGVVVRLGTEALSVTGAEDTLRLLLADGSEISAARVFCCGYSQINKFLAASRLPEIPMKHEITEVALIEPAAEMSDVGVTVMDGPFFSTLPFPPQRLHSLTHVRYTPHCELPPEAAADPHRYLREHPCSSRSVFMLRDAQRYLPVLQQARYRDSLYEVKTVLPQHEVDDGRPILCRAHHGLRNLWVVMGAKIDNIYDVFQRLKSPEETPARTAATHA